MGEGAETGAARLDDPTWTRLADIVRRFDESWRALSEVEIASFLPGPDDPIRNPVLVELVKVDQECRWRRGEQKKLEAYLAEWPELGIRPEVVAELLEAECLIRALLETLPCIEELQARFPQVCGTIDLARIRVEAESDRRTRRASVEGGERSDEMLQGDSSWDDGPRVLRAGEQFGRYAIRGLVGRGAMGSVYRAYDTQLEREVALKIPDFDTTSDPEVLDRFVREAPAAAKIRHPNVCPIFDAGRIDDQYYLTMALIEGQTLVDWMKDRMVNPREAAELARKLARALEAVHAVGVVHRDLKASNVMIDRSGEPLLMDFGLARQSKADDPLTPNDSFLGTPAYMSPEQVNREPADARSDIYGVGVLFYQLLTGQLPFSGPLTKVMASIRHSEPPLPRLLNPNLDPQLEAICLKAMAKTPGDRYQSAAEMAEALQGYLEMPFETARPPSRRSPLIWIAAAGGDVLILAALAIRTGEGELELLVDQPGVTITIDGKPIQVSSPRDTLPVPIGDHVLVVRAKGFETRTVSFSIRWRWDAKQLEVRLDPVRRSSAFAENERPDAVIERWIETGARVMGIQISSDGSTLHAAYTEHPAPSRVQAFDVLSGRLLQTISFNDAGYDHHALALSGNQRYLYVTNYFRTDISQIDLQDRNSRRDMEIGGRWASAMGITPDGRLLVVPSGQDGRSEDEENDRVSILDLSNGRLSLNGQLTLNDEPVGHRLGFSADSKLAYLVTRPRKSAAPTLVELRLAPPYDITRNLPFREGQLMGVAVSSSLKRAFVSDAGHRKVWAVDLKTFKPASGIELDGCSPGMLALAPNEDVLVVLCPANRELFCVSPKDGSLRARLDGLRQDPADAAFSPNQERLLVAHGGSAGGIAVVNMSRLLAQYSIVFASNRAGESYQLYLTGIGPNSPVRLTKNHATDRSPRWSPDGHSIAFISDREGLPRVLLMSRNGTDVSVLKNTDPVWGNPAEGVPLDWSPDGVQLAFVGGQHTAIRTVDVKTGEIRTLIQGEAGNGYSHHLGLCWRRSDGTLLFNSQHPGSVYNQAIFEVDPRTRKVSQFATTDGKGVHFSAPTSSPDGAKVIVLRHANQSVLTPSPIYMMSANGIELAALGSTGDHVNGPTRWSPTGCPPGPRRRSRLPTASGPQMPAVFAAGVPPRRVVDALQVEIGTSAAVSPPASVALPQGIPAPHSTAGCTAAPETFGRTPSANSIATPAAPRWPRHLCLP